MGAEIRRAKSRAPPNAGAGQRGTGTYNAFYREFGTRTVATRRTSIITDPPNGRLPPLTPAAEDVKRRRIERQRRFENPEDLGLQDRCLAFLTSGPPLLPYSYNSNYQIIQTRDAFVIHAEMIHETRIVHLDGRPHLAQNIRSWMGDSIGRWNGDTLVVDTTNFNDAGGFYGDAGGNFGWDRNLHMIERFRLLDADTLLYQFEMHNPTAFTRSWKGELTMTRGDRPHLRVRMPRGELLTVQHPARLSCPGEKSLRCEIGAPRSTFRGLRDGRHTTMPLELARAPRNCQWFLLPALDSAPTKSFPRLARAAWARSIAPAIRGWAERSRSRPWPETIASTKLPARA